MFHNMVALIVLWPCLFVQSPYFAGNGGEQRSIDLVVIQFVLNLFALFYYPGVTGARPRPLFPPSGFPVPPHCPSSHSSVFRLRSPLLPPETGGDHDHS